MKLLTGVFGLIWKFYIAIIFVFFAILLYPFFFAVLFRPHWKKFSFYLFIFWSWMMRIFCFYRVKTIENHELPDGPYVIIANHTSYLDIFFMYSILPKHPFVFLGISRLTNPHLSVSRLRKELSRNSIYIPLDRPGPERAVSQVPPGHIFGVILDFGLAPSRGLFSACTNFLSTSVSSLFSTFDVAVWGLSHAWLF